MGISGSTRKPRMTRVSRDRLFYDVYEYCVSFGIVEASALRGLNPVRIDRVITMRRSFRSIITWSSEKKIYITDQHLLNLHTLCSFLLQATEPFKLVLSGDRVWVYANCWEFLKKVTQSPGVIRTQYSRAVIDRPIDTIVLKNPHHAQRSYFREQAVGALQKEQLISFFNNHRDNIRLSPSLVKWLQWPTRRIYSYFFVDYDHGSWPLMISLVHPGLIRKTVQLLPDK
jgi:hypothetical protein